MAIVVETVSNSSAARTDLDKVRRAVEGIDKTAKSATSTMASFAKAVAAVAAVGFAAKGLTQVSDALTNLETKLKLSTNSVKEARKSFKALANVASSTRSDINAVATLYQKTTIATQKLGMSQRQVIRFTDLVTKSLSASGATATEQFSAIMQLGQGLASGKLAGDELRTVMEAAPIFARELASGLDVSVGKIREMGAAGELTAMKIMGALFKRQSQIDTIFGKVGVTFSSAFTNLSNSFTFLFDGFQKAADVSFGNVAAGLNNLARKMIDIGLNMSFYFFKASDKLKLITSDISNLLYLVEQGVDETFSLISAIAAAISTAFASAFNFLGTIGATLVDGFKAAFDYLRYGLVIDVTDYFKGLSETADLIESWARTVEGWFFWVYDKVIGNSWIPDLVNGVVDWMKKLLQAPLHYVEVFVATVSSQFASLSSLVVTAFSAISLLKFRSHLWSLLRVFSVVGAAGAVAFGLLSVSASSIADAFMGGSSSKSSSFLSGIAAFLKPVKDALETSKVWLSSLISGISSFFKKAFDGAVVFVKDLVSRLDKGLTNMFGGLYTGFKSLISELKPLLLAVGALFPTFSAFGVGSALSSAIAGGLSFDVVVGAVKSDSTNLQDVRTESVVVEKLSSWFESLKAVLISIRDTAKEFFANVRRGTTAALVITAIQLLSTRLTSVFGPTFASTVGLVLASATNRTFDLNIGEAIFSIVKGFEGLLTKMSKGLVTGRLENFLPLLMKIAVLFESGRAFYSKFFTGLIKAPASVAKRITDKLEVASLKRESRVIKKGSVALSDKSLLQTSRQLRDVYKQQVKDLKTSMRGARSARDITSALRSGTTGQLGTMNPAQSAMLRNASEARRRILDNADTLRNSTKLRRQNADALKKVTHRMNTLNKSLREGHDKLVDGVRNFASGLSGIIGATVGFQLGTQLADEMDVSGGAKIAVAAATAYAGQFFGALAGEALVATAGGAIGMLQTGIAMAWDKAPWLVAGAGMAALMYGAFLVFQEKIEATLEKYFPSLFEDNKVDMQEDLANINKELVSANEALKTATDENKAAIEANIVALTANKEALKRNIASYAADKRLQRAEGPNLLSISDAIKEATGMGEISTPAEKAANNKAQAEAIGGVLERVLSPLIDLLRSDDASIKRASGGAVWGAGTATSDSIPAYLSNGEFVINAAATGRNRGLLESINNGNVPKFADGGIMEYSSEYSDIPPRFLRLGTSKDKDSINEYEFEGLKALVTNTGASFRWPTNQEAYYDSSYYQGAHLDRVTLSPATSSSFEGLQTIAHHELGHSLDKDVEHTLHRLREELRANEYAAAQYNSDPKTVAGSMRSYIKSMNDGNFQGPVSLGASEEFFARLTDIADNGVMDASHNDWIETEFGFGLSPKVSETSLARLKDAFGYSEGGYASSSPRTLLGWLDSDPKAWMSSLIDPYNDVARANIHTVKDSPDLLHVKLQGDVTEFIDDAVEQLAYASEGRGFKMSIDSLGGTAEPAFEAGRLLQTMFDASATMVDSGDSAASAGSILWAHGASRDMDMHSTLGIHSAHYNGWETIFPWLSVKAVNEQQQELFSSLSPTMDPVVAKALSSTDMSWFSAQDVKKLGLYAQGGLASKGRDGDSLLAHINEEEAALLSAFGGSGAVNPRTGLREYANTEGVSTLDVNVVNSKLMVEDESLISQIFQKGKKVFDEFTTAAAKMMSGDPSVGIIDMLKAKGADPAEVLETQYASFELEDRGDFSELKASQMEKIATLLDSIKRWEGRAADEGASAFTKATAKEQMAKAIAEMDNVFESAFREGSIQITDKQKADERRKLLENAANTVGKDFSNGIRSTFGGAFKKYLKDGDGELFKSTMLDKFTGDILNSFAEGLMEPFSKQSDSILKGLGSDISSFGQSLTSGISDSLGGMFKDSGGLSGLLKSGWGMITGLFAAEGGYVSGPGTGTSDSIPARLSDGEFVVNAAATRANLGMFQAINSGSMRRFAVGGLATNLAPVDTNTSVPQSTVVNLNITGDVSRQTKKEIYSMAPQIASMVEGNFRERRVMR